MNNPKYYWLRWIAVLPAAAACYLGLYFLLHWLVNFGLTYDHNILDIIYASVKSLFFSGLASYSFIAVGVYLAPKYKKTVALILLIIIAALMGVAISLMVTKGFKLMYGLEIIAQMIGAWVGYVMAKDV